jgi:hypothetical protein
VYGLRLLCGWAAGVLGVSAAPCQESNVSVAGGPLSTASQWREFGVAGRMLVHESGHLSGESLSANYLCAPWRIHGQLAVLQGRRAYQGQTSAGRAVVSHSSIRQQEGKLQVFYEFTDAWQLGGQLTRLTLKREIASASGALGYPEHFDWTSLSMGVQWHPRLGPGQWTLTAWMGTSLDSRLRVTLPGRDTTSMPPGASQHRALAASWRTQLTPGWYLQASVDYRRTDLDLGAPAVVRRHGLPVGTVHQPETQFTDRMAAVHLGYTF